MSGKIEFKIKQGKTNFQKGVAEYPHPVFDKKLGFYPNWYLEIIGEDNQITTITPTIEEIAKIISEIMVYEKLMKYDVFKKNETMNGTTRMIFQEAIDKTDREDIKEVRKKFSEKSEIYKEMLLKLNNEKTN